MLKISLKAALPICLLCTALPLAAGARPIGAGMTHVPNTFAPHLPATITQRRPITRMPGTPPIERRVLRPVTLHKPVTQIKGRSPQTRKPIHLPMQPG